MSIPTRNHKELTGTHIQHHAHAIRHQLRTNVAATERASIYAHSLIVGIVVSIVSMSGGKGISQLRRGIRSNLAIISRADISSSSQGSRWYKHSAHRVMRYIRTGTVCAEPMCARVNTLCSEGSCGKKKAQSSVRN